MVGLLGLLAAPAFGEGVAETYLLDVSFKGSLDETCIYGVLVLKLPEKIPVSGGYTKYPYYAARLPGGEYAIIVVAFKGGRGAINFTQEFKGEIYAGYTRLTLDSDTTIEVELLDPREFELRSVSVKVVFENGTPADGAQVFGASLGRPTSLGPFGQGLPENLPLYLTISATDSNGSATIMLPKFPSLVSAAIYSGSPWAQNLTYTCTCIANQTPCDCPPPPKMKPAENYGGFIIVLPEEEEATVVLHSFKDYASLSPSLSSIARIFPVVPSHSVEVAGGNGGETHEKPEATGASPSGNSEATSIAPQPSPSAELSVKGSEPSAFMTTLLLGATGIIILVVIIVVIAARKR